MGTKSLDALLARLQTIPADHRNFFAVAFLVRIHTSMQDQGISNVELARRIGTSPAYVTRMFRSSTNLSVHTMVKLAQAVGSRLALGLGGDVASQT